MNAFLFWTHVLRAEGCWLWLGQKNTYGYGRTRVDGRLQLAHRVSYELAHGSIPAKALVLHRCDNPACVRPDHLWLGSHVDNMADRASKRRSAHGEGHGHHKLSEREVLQMRDERTRLGTPLLILARRFGVHRTTARDIVRGWTWRHLLPENVTVESGA